MIKQIVLTLVIGSLLNIGQTYAEEASALDKLKTLGKESVTKFQESSKLATETKSTEYRDSSNSNSIDIFCNTQAYTQGQKFISGVGCIIDYKFSAKNTYSGSLLTGTLLNVKAEDECDKAIAICKAAKFGFKDSDKNLVDIIHNNKIIGTIDFSKDVIGFSPK